MTERPLLFPKAFPSSSLDVARRFRGYLPHVEGARRVYFVTFRLADSLPREVLDELREERRLRRIETPAAGDIAKRLSDSTAKKVERMLDRGSGACHLRQPEIGKMVASAICRFDGERYQLHAWCVMPNHVHAVVEPMGAWKLARILHAWKSFTAHKANAILRNGGEFWQREYYDRMLRNGREFLRAVEYVAKNPEKAGLRDWPWVWSCLS